MASLEDIVVSAAINCLSAALFLLAFAILRLQPYNDRVYFPKWYIKGMRTSPTSDGTYVKRFVNLDVKLYFKFLDWMPAALKMSEAEIIHHAGFDSAVYIRIYLLGLKIFIPITILSFCVLVPINYTGENFEALRENMIDLQFSDIDKLSISNIAPGSRRLYAHIAMAYIFTLWTCYILYREYMIVAKMRLLFIATRRRSADQFTVLVRNVPPLVDESVSEHVEHFFSYNHPDYLTHQVVYNANTLASMVSTKKNMQNWLTYYTNKFERHPNKRPLTKAGFCGLWGPKVDAIDLYNERIENISKEETAERERVLNDPTAIMPVAFVSFKSRWGAAVCAQTVQSHNPTRWLTDWAPEPRDVYWANLAIRYVELNVRKLLMAVALFLLIFCYMIPIAFVQTLANIEGIQKVFPFLRPLIEMGSVKAVIQGYLPGIILKVFLILVPFIIMIMSKIEGHTAFSKLEDRSAGKYHLFLFVNVFLGSIITGTALQQLKEFLNESPTEMPRTVGVSIPMKATFFITYVMVDGWSGVAAEILRLIPLIIYHLKNSLLVKTEKDREEAMDPGCLTFAITEPRIQLYFLLGLVYSTVTPVILPFIIIFFAFAYVVFRHQVINVYDQKYESGATFWPDVHRRIIIGLVISHILFMGLMSTKRATNATLLLIPLPILTFWFFKYTKARFEPQFRRFPLEDAMKKDRLEKANDPNLNLKVYLQDAYVHPVFKGKTEYERPTVIDEEENSPLVATTQTQEEGASEGKNETPKGSSNL